MWGLQKGSLALRTPDRSFLVHPAHGKKKNLSEDDFQPLLEIITRVAVLCVTVCVRVSEWLWGSKTI